MIRRSRREFIRDVAAGGLGFWAAERAEAQESRSPNEQVNFACIGVGGKGGSDSSNAGRLGNVVAICDVDDERLNKAALRFPGARKFNDWRKMFDAMANSIDAVTVSTPDHSHAVAAAAAMHLGKHCFCQKPLTHSIWEARRLGDIARDMKVVTQMGNQGTAEDGLRKSAALVQAGALGKVTEVHVWTNRPIWPQGKPRPAACPTPSNLHWDLWLGPAPARPYAEYPDETVARLKPAYHPWCWRGWWDFGTGALGDMACHIVNMPYMALDLKNPVSVEAHTSGHNRDSYPLWSVITFQFPATKTRGPVTLTWYDGGKRPPNSLVPSDLLDEKGELSSGGSLIVGDKGKLYTTDDYGSGGHIIDGVDVGQVKFTRSPGHFEEYVEAIKGGPMTVSNFANYAGPLTETVLLGNLAVWADGKKIEWDARHLRAKNAPEVAHVIRPHYRRGYSI